ncbi:MAG: sulfatase-like hydrolase/transferase [Verrucomicrobiales bacterium]|jgi:arylsulfatase A-like enzyme|nr:sulfatase-like hydrolase/transferase [Verrucomicrobiales bacterium]
MSTRREFIKTTTFSGAAWSLAGLGPAAGSILSENAPAPPRRPNIVFILSDDQGAWTLGNPEIITPNLDRLAATGVRCPNFFCASPVCSPARASILTGAIPSVHGVHDWLRAGNLDMEQFASLTAARPGHYQDEHAAVDYLQNFTTYTDLLADCGYTCALSGKWHLGDSIRPRRGFHHWFTIARGGCDYFHADTVSDGQVKFETRYVTDLITDRALAMLDDLRAGAAPFYLGVHYTAPHSPWDAANHQPEHLDLYRDCPFATVPDLPPHPWQIDTAPRGHGPAREELLRGYFAAITAMDAGIGKIIRKLAERPDPTIIIFTSDNGMNMGHHGIWGKGNGTFPQNMYDTSVKVPFIISYPGHLRPGVCENLLSHYDIFPTLLDYLGLGDWPGRSRLVGRSFARVVNGQAPGADEFVVVFDEYGPVRMIRNAQWKYIRRYPHGPNELYHVARDPEETRNLIAAREHQPIAEQLNHRLLEFYTRHADPRVDGTREHVTGYGQLRRAGLYAEGKPVYHEG